MDYLISFVVSVMTNIAAYIVRKWIDKQSQDKIKGRCTAIQRPFGAGEHSKSEPEASLLEASCMPSIHILLQIYIFFTLLRVADFTRRIVKYNGLL